jgi:hypothetical protein
VPPQAANESLKRDPHAGDLYIFRGRRGDLAKILWHDGIGLSLYAKRLDRGKFIWPAASAGAVSISAAQMAAARCPPRSEIPRCSSAGIGQNDLHAAYTGWVLRRLAERFSVAASLVVNRRSILTGVKLGRLFTIFGCNARIPRSLL